MTGVRVARRPAGAGPHYGDDMNHPRRFGHGLVIGKFYPLHAGHQALVRAATSSCDRVTVEVMVQGVESIPAAVRVGWVQGEHPDARVVAVLDDSPVDFESPQIWDLHMAVIEAPLDGPVDAVFSSDAYGEELARRLNATWVQVDPGRASTPISGTAVRHDPAGNWWALPTPVRQWFTKRIVVLDCGNDHTTRASASTVLGRALADHYGTRSVPDRTLETSDESAYGAEPSERTTLFELIAAHQSAAEHQAAGLVARPLLICESNAPALVQSLERPPSLQDEAVTATAPALNVLVGRDTAPSPIRDVLERVRVETGTPWVEVTGSPNDSLAAAIAAVDEIIASGWSLADPLG